MDKDAMKKYKTFKTAITHFLAEKKLLGALSLFIKYLFEKESFISYSQDNIFKLLES